MRIISLFFFVVALGLWPRLVQAVEVATFTLKTTDDLYRVCLVGPDDTLHQRAVDFCAGYLLGVVNYHDAVTSRENLKRLICYPQTATRDQGIQAFVDWAASHQQDRKFMDDPPVFGAVRGLAAKWPCK